MAGDVLSDGLVVAIRFNLLLDGFGGGLHHQFGQARFVFRIEGFLHGEVGHPDIRGHSGFSHKFAG
jgi:hypothetical protein